MAINILSKADKKLSQLKDGIRVLAWEQYKIDNRVKGEEGYKIFEAEWLTHDIHKMDQAKFDKFIAGLGYTVDDLLAERNRYYQKRNRATGLVMNPLVLITNLPVLIMLKVINQITFHTN
jgi:hypothetical protein